MPEPTAAEAMLAAYPSDRAGCYSLTHATLQLEAFGIDPTAPMSLLDWHVAATTRETLARQVEDLVPDLSDDPHTAGYAQALLDVLQLIDPDRSTR